MTVKTEQRIALVTGASRGLGFAAARALAAEGAHILAVARTQGGLEALDDAIRAEGGSASLIPADLHDIAGIQRLSTVVQSRWGRLDVLVASAGVLGPLTPTTQITTKEMADVFTVNTLANHALLANFEPLLRAAPRPRAVFVTSGAPRSLRPFFSAYAASKAALEAMVLCYAREIAHTPLKVNLLDPGPVATAMRKQAVPGEDQSTLPQAEDLAPVFLELTSETCDKHGELIKFQNKV